MKALLSLTLFFVFGFCAAAADLVIADRGKSAYKIVYAESAVPETAVQIRESAETLQQIIKCAAGAELPLVSEKSFKSESPAIFVGQVKALGKRSEKRWEHHIKADGKNLFIWGDDRFFKYNTVAGAPYRMCITGTHQAVMVFAKKFAGAVFLILPELKHSVPYKGRIAVPATYGFNSKVQIEYCISRFKNINYDLGNNFRAAPWNRTFGGHSHNLAVPWQKYWKSNPEFFCMYSPGKFRYCYKVRPQYCLSTPRVKELIYQQLLSELDAGYEQTQLGQSDSFKACYCPECIKDRGELSPGERLWQIHRDMAERLLKDRPGKKVVIMAYGPTQMPPVTFKQFPKNVIIELAPAAINHDSGLNSLWSRWKKFDCPKVVYLYNWGFYNFSGFSPNREMDYLVQQLKVFYDIGVIGLYRCGFGELPGLEGPVYHVWGQLIDDPGADAGKLLNNYCRVAYGKSAAFMESFHKEMDKAVKSKEPVISDWNRDINPGRRFFLRFDLKLMADRYPEKVLVKLEKLLAAAEKNSDSPMLKIVRTEFDLLKHNARCAALFFDSTKKKNAAAAGKLLEAIRERNKYIASLPLNPKGQCVKEGVILFGGVNMKIVKTGGRLCSVYNAPFHWDLEAMKRLDIIPFGRTLKADGKDTGYLVPRCIDDKTPAVVNFKRTVTVRAALEKDKLKVYVEGTNLDPKSRKNLRIRLKIGPDKANRHQFFAKFANGAMSDSVPDGFIKKPLIFGQQEKWKASSAVRPLIRMNAPDKAVITIPLAKISKKLPVSGDKWLFNVSVYVPHRVYEGGFVWESALDQLDWEQSFDTEGTLLFTGK